MKTWAENAWLKIRVYWKAYPADKLWRRKVYKHIINGVALIVGVIGMVFVYLTLWLDWAAEKLDEPV